MVSPDPRRPSSGRWPRRADRRRSTGRAGRRPSGPAAPATGGPQQGDRALDVGGGVPRPGGHQVPGGGRRGRRRSRPSSRGAAGPAVRVSSGPANRAERPAGRRRRPGAAPARVAAGCRCRKCSITARASSSAPSTSLLPPSTREVGALDVRSGVGQQPHVVAVPHQVHADRGGRGRPPTRRTRPARRRGGRAAGVQQHRAAGSARAAPRGGPSARRSRAVERQCTRRRSSPWRYSRVTDVVLARRGQRPGAALAAARHSPASRDRRQRLRPRGDDERVRRGEGPGQLAHAERVGQPHWQRPERVAAAHVGADRVGHLAPAARLHPVQHEPRPGARARRAPCPRAAAGRWAAGRCCPAAACTAVSWPAATRAGPSRRRATTSR